MIAEPLGRFFLKSYVMKGTEEEKVLNFTEALFSLRRRDPLGVVNALDIVALVERFGVNIPLAGGKMISAAAVNVNSQSKKDKDSSNEGANGVINASATDDDTSIGSPAIPTHTKTHVSVDIAPYGTNEAPMPTDSMGNPINGVSRVAASSAKKNDTSQNDEGNGDILSNGVHHVGSLLSMQAVEREPGSKGAAQSAWTETHVSRHDGDKHDDAANPTSTFAANFSTSVNTYGAATAAVVSRAAASLRHHTQKSFDLNSAVQLFIEAGLANAFDRLKNDKKTFTYYLKLKWYSLQAVNDNQMRYHRVLGTGAFGTVNGCIVACLGGMLAMKTMDKKRIKAKKARSQVVAERQALEALAACPSPYCMRLRYAYQTKEAFHLILPLAIGGDLKFHLKDGPFSEERARIYAAEVALGLGHIHSLGLIIRDLKPRNILLNSNGHCQISDLGLAVSIADGRTCRGRAGTEGYWSPEVINNLHYSIDADWWSYGCCLFEFHTGFNPFSCKHTGMKTRNEGTRKSKIRFTKDFPETAKPLVNALLNRNVSERLGCRGKGVAEVLNEKHAYWRPLDLDKVRRNELPAPWLPEKGVIYALSQVEIQENADDVELKKVKLTSDDEIEFSSFADIEEHQHDIVKVLEISISNANSQGENRESMGKSLQLIIQNDEEKATCCTIS